MVGRRDTQAKINGYRIELNEIKCVIEKLLKCCSVVFTINQQAGGKIAVFIVREQLQKDEKVWLERQILEVLPEYMLPHYYLSGSSIPLTDNGKVDLDTLRHMLYTKNCSSL